MRPITCAIALGTMFLLLGCPARSLFPLFTQDEREFNPALVGTWMDPGDGETFTFEKAAENSYTVTIKDPKSGSESYQVQSGKIGKHWFLDSYPTKSGQDHHYLPTHIISMVQIDGDTLRVSSLESDRLRELANAQTLNAAYVHRDDDIILTAPTTELRALVLRLAEDGKAFPNPGALVRVK